MMDETTRAVYHDDVIAEMNTDKIRLLNREMSATFESLCPDFLDWIGELSRFGGNPIDAMVLDEEPSKQGSVFKASLFTERHIYHITAMPSWNTETEGHEGCLSAFVGNRMFRAGDDENWERSSYLADGPYNEDTWQRIMADIIGHEMVRLGK